MPHPLVVRIEPHETASGASHLTTEETVNNAVERFKECLAKDGRQMSLQDLALPLSHSDFRESDITTFCSEAVSDPDHSVVMFIARFPQHRVFLINWMRALPPLEWWQHLLCISVGGGIESAIRVVQAFQLGMKTIDGIYTAWGPMHYRPRRLICDVTLDREPALTESE